MNLSLLDTFRNRLADDYIDVCLVNERDFYESVKDHNFTRSSIQSYVLDYLPKLSREFIHGNDDLIVRGTEKRFIIQFLFTPEQVAKAIDDIYEYYEEAREELETV